MIAKPELLRNQPDDGQAENIVPAQVPAGREASQTTLSTVGDVTVAATDSIGRLPDTPRAMRWFPVVGFFVLIYAATCLVVLFSFKRDPWVRAFLTPIFPVLIATLVFAWRQMWKFRAQRATLKMKIWQHSLGSLSHEAASGLNGIRANLSGLRLANSPESHSELLSAIELATARLDKALQKANTLLASREQ